MYHIRILLCVTVCCALAPLVHSAIQYKSQKIRGPPVPSRLTRNPQHLGTYTHQYQYTKSKRPQPQRNTGRPSNVRPIPVHMASYKVPVLSRPPKTPAPLIFPSAVWKTPTAVYRPPVDNAKPFFVNPPVSHQHQQLQHQQIQHQQHQQLQLQQQQQQLQHQQHQQHLQNQQHQQQQIQLQQFDYHINKEPMLNIPTIKQIGEKGPIHTIPAPNLSPADKPKVIYEEPAKQSYYQYTKQQEVSPNSIQQSSISNSIAPAALIGAQALPLVSSLPLPQIPNYQVQQTHIPNYQIQHSQIPVQQSAVQTHQYQVTENSEGPDPLQQSFNGQNTYFAPDPDTNFIQKLTQLTDTNTAGNNNNLKLYSQDMFVSPHQFVSNAANSQLSAQDLYQLLNGAPQQQLVDSYGMPLMQQPQLQQHFIQQAAQNVPSQNYQFIQPQIDNAAYFNQIPDTVSQQIKDNFKPQFQTFNYEEPKKDFAQSRVTADYSIEPQAADSSPKVVQQTPQEALAQTQYIQQYFQTREDTNVADNELESEHEGSTKASQILSQLSANNEISPTMFYSSLPNKEAAEALANLQAAGSINTILKLNQNKNEQQGTNQRDSMRIFVPDDEEAYDDLETSVETNKKNQDSQGYNIFETTHLKKDVDNSRSGESSEYEDYSGEDNASRESSEQEANFGNKLKTKTSTR